MTETVLILLVVVVLPLWLTLHYYSINRKSRGLSREDEKMLAEIWENTRKMEDRIHTLERILDDTSPAWRRKS